MPMTIIIHVYNQDLNRNDGKDDWNEKMNDF